MLKRKRLPDIHYQIIAPPGTGARLNLGSPQGIPGRGHGSVLPEISDAPIPPTGACLFCPDSHKAACDDGWAALELPTGSGKWYLICPKCLNDQPADLLFQAAARAALQVHLRPDEAATILEKMGRRGISLLCAQCMTPLHENHIEDVVTSGPAKGASCYFSQAEVLQAAGRMGWAKIGDFHYCPPCATEESRRKPCS